MKRLALVLFLLLSMSGAAFADTAADADVAKSLTVKSFQFKHKDAERAATMIKPLMSADGSIAIQPSSNSIVITDRPENLKAISAKLAQFDTPAQPVKLVVRLIAATRGAGGARVPEALKDVSANLAVLPFNAYEVLGSATVEGKEGDPGMFDLESGYRAEFRFGELDSTDDSVKISDFKLSRLQGDQLTQLLKTTVNLQVGQTLIMGAGKPQGARALMLIISAKK